MEIPSIHQRMHQPPCEDLDPQVGCVYKYFHQCISIPVSAGGLLALGLL